MGKLHNWFFSKVHGNNLVYNTCWEDPRCDRELLQLDDQSEIVMITSAGCNALAYLLDNPSKIHCIDVNSRQNALLELKKSYFKGADFDLLFHSFGKGKLENASTIYKTRLRKYLPDFAQKYWDKNINFFDGKGWRKSFYFHGTAGLLAWGFRAHLKLRKQLYEQIELFFKANSLDEQVALYQQFEHRLWSKTVGWIMNQHMVMSLAGVPKSQQKLFVTKYENGALGFIQESINNVFTKLPVKENYFYHLYFNGNYTETCCPSYLKQNNFQTLQDRVEKVQTYTTTVSQFLRDNPGQYTHFVLLDHQDWLADNDLPSLNEEWELILKNSQPGTKILLRSAAKEVDFFPDFVLDQVAFNNELTAEVHQKDRVGTYASTYMGIVK